MKLHAWNSTKRYFLNIVTILLVLLTLVPILWLLQTALKPQIFALEMPPRLIFLPTFTNFELVFKHYDFLKSYLNSVIIGLSTTVISIVLGTACGYGLARARFRASKVMGIWIILIRMAPPVGFALPLYIMMRAMHLIDTYIGLVLLYLTATLPFFSWLMSGFFKTVPRELEEAAQIDGCTRVRTLFSVGIPLVVPGMVTCAIFSFIMSWNEFLYALIIAGRHTRTAPVILQGFVNFKGIQWGELSAASLLVTIPVIVFSLLVQRGLIRGLMGGAIKS